MAKPQVFSLIYRQLVKWFIGTVWPWFVVTIWPEIQKELLEIFKGVRETAGNAFREWMDNRGKQRAEAAAKSAMDAEAAARNATTVAEAEKQRAIAAVWRQVAEQFRQENEELKAKLAEMLDRATSEFQGGLNAMSVKTVIQEADDGTLQLAGSGARLLLPAPGAES